MHSRDWQTTLAGVVILLFLLYAAYLAPDRFVSAVFDPSADSAVFGGLLAAGVGLLRASDAHKRGE